ncbi:MAG: hypothetical protein QOH41_286 [Blastocatellia bacterium]|jgi:hypothetical protein|nr:hypothetical protein [Blastocatellia bacterium]
MNPLETYLQDLYDIHRSGSGVKETSYYGTLANLFNEVGKTLKPRVRCIINLQNQGAGLPDGGLYTADQFQKRTKVEPLEGQLPARGCFEVKSPGEDVSVVAKGEQVQRYLNKYRQVLVTNYRDFILVALDRDGNLEIRERFTLAATEAEFWALAAHPQAAANKLLGERFVEYLKRVMLHAAPLTQPKDVAWFLASYARDCKARIESKPDLPALMTVRSALEEALGLKFEGEKGEHFFRSTLVQTLFYGVFSSWVLWSKSNPPTNKQALFNWHEAAWSLHVPMIKALFDQIATPTQLRELDIVEVLDWTTDVLNRVDRQAFFENFEEGHAVQYFYEPFLQAFDPELRKELGVWYTPIEIVKYMVARVDTVLREELDIPDGLADPRVYVLDPCCGTGAYLVEVLHKIHETLKAKGEDALAANDLKRAAIDRVFGFEILPAPFVVSHLQLGLLLQSLGAPLTESLNERVGVYLTNALTGWEPPSEEVKARLQQLGFAFAELKEEHDAAERVKREVPILVILGNPPYNGFADVAIEEERDLTEAYKTTVKAPTPQGQGLNDFYVRFFRMAERRIVEKKGEGVVAFISNYSWLDSLSCPGMREKYLDVFDGIWIDSLNGDKYRTGKVTPEGKPDPSVFSTELNREGIQVGTAIALLVRTPNHQPADAVRFREWWGKDKRSELLASVTSGPDRAYETLLPELGLGLPFRPASSGEGYETWPRLTGVFPVSFPGVKTSRDNFLVDIDRDALLRRLEAYFDPRVSAEEMQRLSPAVMKDTGRFSAKPVRAYLTKRGFLPENVVRYCYRPFDLRWLYWEPETELLDRKRIEYWSQVFKGNIWFSCTTRYRKEAFYLPLVTERVADLNVIEANVQMFPLFVNTPQQRALHDTCSPEAVNVSERALNYVRQLETNTEDCFFHALSILHSPRYRAENSGALRQDWPRIPLPATKDTLLHSAELGRKIAALLDTEQGVDGVTAGAIGDPFRHIGTVSHVAGKPLDPVEDLKVTAGWGHAGKGGVTMPGKGKIIERVYSTDERKAIERGAPLLGLTVDEALAHLGERTCDVYLNDTAYWKGIPARVWEYTIGGYQVIKKWLSYRELELLSRPLTPDEAREVMNMARRIAAIVLLEPALDANYQAVKDATYPWPV